jgi:hypothetical protein
MAMNCISSDVYLASVRKTTGDVGVERNGLNNDTSNTKRSTKRTYQIICGQHSREPQKSTKLKNLKRRRLCFIVEEGRTATPLLS